MKILDAISERRIEMQAEQASSVLENMITQGESPYCVEIGRTPFNISSKEHMRTVSTKVLENLANTGMNNLVYIEDESIKASTRYAATATLGPIQVPKRKPLLVFQ